MVPNDRSELPSMFLFTSQYETYRAVFICIFWEKEIRDPRKKVTLFLWVCNSAQPCKKLFEVKDPVIVFFLFQICILEYPSALYLF